MEGGGEDLEGMQPRPGGAVVQGEGFGDENAGME